MPYDYLIFALGGRLATEHITGFYEHAHHPLTVEAVLRFGEAIHSFKEGRAVIGYSPEARLVVPVYETAFALSRLLEDRGERGSPCQKGTLPGFGQGTDTRIPDS